MGNMLHSLLTFQEVIHKLNEKDNNDATLLLFMNNGSIIVGDIVSSLFKKEEEETNQENNEDWINIVYKKHNEIVDGLNKNIENVSLHYDSSETIYLNRAIVIQPDKSTIKTDNVIVNLINISSYMIGNKSSFLEQLASKQY